MYRMQKETILTGLRTNGEFHLGNYIGALKPMLDLVHSKADEFQINLFVPDLHSFTTPIDHSSFLAQTIDNLKLYVAIGFPLDHPNVNLYRQSHIPAHSELTWILSNFTGFGEMSRMVEFKDKAERLDQDRVSVGLFSYPILMAADILLYDAKWVPVGDDQRQHLEFAREISTRLNNQFGDLFVVPETIAKQQEFIGRSEAPRIRSLKNPEKKMSKSIQDPAGTILLSDDSDTITKKIMSAETDNLGVINFDWKNQPGITNLLIILASVTGQAQNEVNAAWAGKTSYGDLKKEVASEVCKQLGQIQEALTSVDEPGLLSHLSASEAKMNEAANSKLLVVQKAIGLR